jgi:VIT1/CCC1 family predicted Fe2+/Mn2+ transporter
MRLVGRAFEAKGPEPKDVSSTVDNLARCAMGLVGGISLLAPLLIMTYVVETRYRLIVVCLFVVLVTVLLSLLSKASNQEILGAVAGYTAVLVVYIGSTGT